MEENAKKRIPGIRSKTIVMILGFTATILFIIWLVFVVFLDNLYKQAKTVEIRSAVKTVESMLDSDRDELITGMREISSPSGASIVVVGFDASGSEKYYLASASQMSVLANRMAVNDIIRRAADEGGEVLYTLDSNLPPEIAKRGGIADQDMIYARTVNGDSGSTVIAVSMPLASFDTARSAIMQLLVIVSMLFTVMAVILGRMISDTFAVPLEKLNVSAKDVGTPKYKKMDGDPGCRETAELNDTLERASEEIEKVEKLRRELIANVSHDLRTPLTLISGYGEMMRDIPGENTKENIQIIIDEAEHLNRLVNDVLSISKLENGMERLELSQFNITASLKALISRYSALRAAEGYTLRFEPDREYTVTGDEVKLLQVFYNLINNAITYTGASAYVEIRQSETEHENRRFLRFDVIDDGDGILPENIPYIWDRYYKENRAHKRAGIGTGLGLSIVKRVIDLHGGKYGVESEVNKGSDFYVEIPLDLSAAQKDADEIR